jgi:NADH-quinone oxidoreductase subunit M
LSGFVAEMTVFMGSWQNPETLYRFATILACASIVVTAVYILRAVGQTVMGPVVDSHFNNLGDATWNERLAAILLLAGIIAIGIAPFWLNKLVSPGVEIIMQQVSKAGH